ncbi:MAG: isochorismatase family protein [Rubrivivax sp.]
MKSALLVVDAQVGVLSSIWESKRVIGNLEALVSRARKQGVPVIWVQHADDDELKHGSENWKLAPNFVPAPSEAVIHKKYNSSFAQTDLDRKLKALGVSRIVLRPARRPTGASVRRLMPPWSAATIWRWSAMRTPPSPSSCPMDARCPRSRS